MWFPLAERHLQRNSGYVMAFNTITRASVGAGVSAIHKIHATFVGADLSRPPPIDRPSVDFPLIPFKKLMCITRFAAKVFYRFMNSFVNQNVVLTVQSGLFFGWFQLITIVGPSISRAVNYQSSFRFVDAACRFCSRLYQRNLPP